MPPIGQSKLLLSSLHMRKSLNRNVRLRISVGEGVDGDEHTVAGANVAEGDLVFWPDYGLCVQQVAWVFAGEGCVFKAKSQDASPGLRRGWSEGSVE